MKRTTIGLEHKELYAGMVRLHILHHACEEPIYGLGIIEELSRHGYKLSPGTIYPMLHGMERRGYLESFLQRSGRSRKRLYRATRQGHTALQSARDKVRELFGELILEHEESGKTGTRARPQPK